MGQCLGINDLEEDLYTLKTNHALVSAELYELKEVVKRIHNEFDDISFELQSHVRNFESGMDKLSLKYCVECSTTNKSRELIFDEICSVHREAVSCAKSLFELETNNLILRDSFSPEFVSYWNENAEDLQPKLQTQTVHSSSYGRDLVQKALLRASTHAVLTTKGKSDKLNRSKRGDFSRTTSDSADVFDEEETRVLRRMMTTPALTSGRGVPPPPSSQKLRPLSKTLSFSAKALQAQPIVVSLSVPRGESLGLILKPLPMARDGMHSFSRMLVHGYITHGAANNIAFDAGILVDDVICGVAGRCFSHPDHLSAAILEACNEEPASAAESEVIVELMLKSRGDVAASSRRMERAKEIARRKGRTKRRPHTKKGHGRKHNVERRDESSGMQVVKCGCGIGQYFMHRFISRAIRKRVGKTLRRYCCRHGLGAAPKTLHSVASRRNVMVDQEDFEATADGDWADGTSQGGDSMSMAESASDV